MRLVLIWHMKIDFSTYFLKHFSDDIKPLVVQ